MNLELSSLADLYGREHDPGTVHRELKFAVHGAGAGAIGAQLVCCSDEALNETSARFVRGFAEETLPPLKSGLRAPFRNVTPGGIYSWGSARVAVNNFSLAVEEGRALLLLSKVEAHAAVDHDGTGTRFGRKRRYSGEGTFCGALAALLAGAPDGWLDPLREAFAAEGLDRLAALRDAHEDDRMLLTATTAARLMARNVAMDLQDFRAPVPVVHLIVHGVVLNRDAADTELIGGAYLLDRRGGRPRDRYRGLGDDPTRYRLTKDAGPLRLEDDELGRERDARDHRRLAEATAAAIAAPDDERLAALRASVGEGRRSGGPWGRALLRTSLAVLAEAAPLPTALLLLGEGLVEIRHAHRLHRAAREREVELRRLEAELAVQQAQAHVDALSDEEAGALAGRLLDTTRPAGARASRP